jgi:hypothetical protein
VLLHVERLGHVQGRTVSGQLPTAYSVSMRREEVASDSARATTTGSWVSMSSTHDQSTGQQAVGRSGIG